MRLATVLTPMSDQNLALAAQCGVTSTDELWRNLEQCLRLLVPVAEASGVTMCMHPDGPLAAALLGQDRIMNSVENFERLVTLVPSRSNGICFCQGTFAAMEVTIPQTIRRLGQQHWIRPLPRHQRHSRQLRGDVSRPRPQRQGRGDEGVSRHRLHGSDPTGSRSATFRRRRRRTRIHPTRSSVRLWRHTGPDARHRKSTERQSNVPDKRRLESELRARFVYSYPIHVVVFVRELCWHRHAACSLLRKKILGHPADRGHITECFHKTGCGNSKPPMCLTLISTESFIPI